MRTMAGILALASCSPKSEGPGGPLVGSPTGETGGAAVYVDGDGFPELTGPVGLSPATLAPDDTLTVEVPVDADTAWVRLAIEDYPSSLSLVQNWAEEGGPSTTVQAEIVIPIGTSAPAGTYYVTLELCSSATCVDPFRRVAYERLGDGATYGRTDYDSPPLTQLGDTWDSTIPIATFELTE